MPPRKSKTKSTYQLKVTLKEINPPIWRRLLVPSNASLQDLHDILQLSMGWLDYHLFEFTKAGIHYSPPDPERDLTGDSSRPTLDPQRISLSTVLFNPGDRMDYLYDFGDGWEHEIILESILPRPPGPQCPSCLDGARACPPEDCGSTPGYGEILEAMRDPQHPERERYLEWLGEPYDPEKFDLKQVNLDLENPEAAWERKSEEFDS